MVVINRAWSIISETSLTQSPGAPGEWPWLGSVEGVEALIMAYQSVAAIWRWA